MLRAGSVSIFIYFNKRSPKGSENSPTDSDLLEEITELEEKKEFIFSWSRHAESRN